MIDILGFLNNLVGQYTKIHPSVIGVLIPDFIDSVEVSS
jgi:hypothetical protein